MSLTETTGRGPTRVASAHGRVLVTGGAGFIGHHLVGDLLARGAAVTVLDDVSTGSWDNLPTRAGLRCVEGCVTDPGAVAAAVDAGDGPTTMVYHLAGIVGVRLATERRRRAYDVAVEGTRTVLDATGNAPAVLFSSSAVYGLHRAERAVESALVSATDALQYDGGDPGYACGKRQLEQLGATSAAGGRAVLVVRPFNVVGRGQASAYGMVLPRFLEAAAAGRPLVVYDDGGQSRAFSDVSVFLGALQRLTACEAAWGQVVNVGSPRATTILELARTVCSATAARLGIEATIRHQPYGEAFPGRVDVRVRAPDTTLLTRLVGAIDWPDTAQFVGDLLALPATSLAH